MAIEWLRVEPISSGEYRATLTNIRLALGATSGKPMLIWTFKLDSGHLIDYYTSKRGEGARKGYEASCALGLSRQFRRSDAVGLQCRLIIDSSCGYEDVQKVLPA